MEVQCMVRGCSQLASLTDTSRGRFWSFSVVYCADCYDTLQKGGNPPIDVSRIIVQPITRAPNWQAEALTGSRREPASA